MVRDLISYRKELAGHACARTFERCCANRAKRVYYSSNMAKYNLLAFAMAFFLASCISDEPMNTECDIEQVSLHLDVPTQMFYHDYDTLQIVPSATDSIRFTTRSYVQIGQLPLSLRVTDKSKAYLVGQDGVETVFRNGTLVDFSAGKSAQVRVVSEDGVWSRLYRISVVNDMPSEGDMTFDFAEYRLDESGKYYVWPVTDPAMAGAFYDAEWKNGNPGFKLSKQSAKPMEYPTIPVADGGPDGGNCIKLETMDTGPFGNMVGMRIASGSLFNGSFDVGYALKNARKATLFGCPFRHKPERLVCWLKFEQGGAFQDKAGQKVEGVVDEPDAYAVVYRNQDEEGHRVQLDGDDVLSSPYIVGMARLSHHKNADGTDQLSDQPIHGLNATWQCADLPVVYTEELDPELLANNGYNLVIGFASSWQGAYFQGAVGTKLFVANVSLVCEH